MYTMSSPYLADVSRLCIELWDSFDARGWWDLGRATGATRVITGGENMYADVISEG